MKNGRMQCKDIPDAPVLEFLARLARGEILMTWARAGMTESWRPPVATWYWSDDYKPANSVLNAMPSGTPEYLALAKMRVLMRRGLVEGCACGCRGDFELTDKGRAAATPPEGK